MLHILTLSYNGADKLSKLHTTLIPALDGIDFLWYIKDNGSKDATTTIISLNKWNNVNLISYPDNRQNFSAGCNFLFKEANPKDDDYIMLLNNDIMFNDKLSIKNMLNILNNDDSVGIVGARLLYTGTDILQHAGVVFNPTYKTPMHFKVGQKSDEDAKKNRLFQAITGAVCITKANCYKNIFKNVSGNFGLDENYFWAFDDTDMCLSIKYNMKKKVVYCGNTNIFHEESATLKKNPVNKLFLNNNLKYLFNKWQGRYAIDQRTYTEDKNYNLY